MVDISEKNFESTIKCALLAGGPDACPGDEAVVREPAPAYGTLGPGSGPSSRSSTATRPGRASSGGSPGRLASDDDAFREKILAEEYEGPGNVQTTTLEELDLQPKQEFLYLFDYGDGWRFKVRVYAINPDAPEGEYPRIVESVGEAPEQYPDWE